MDQCPRCAAPVAPDMRFCPRCGKKLSLAPPSVSFGTQLLVYLVSFFLPPFGLIYLPRYFKSGGVVERRVAWTVVVLTIVSLAATFWASALFLQSANRYIQDNLGAYQ